MRYWRSSFKINALNLFPLLLHTSVLVSFSAFSDCFSFVCREHCLKVKMSCFFSNSKWTTTMNLLCSERVHVFIGKRYFFADFLEPLELQRYAVRLCPYYYNTEEWYNCSIAKAVKKQFFSLPTWLKQLWNEVSAFDIIYIFKDDKTHW
jgi:hypothetical protein